MARIFLSHSSRNNPEAVALRDWLTSEGWDDLFLDLDPTRGIAAGERWERSLYEAANRCEAVLFLVSRTWLASDWCLKEFRLAQKLNKRTFGILIEDLPIGELPPELTSQWQFVNLAQGSDHEIFHPTLPDGSERSVSFSKAGLQRLKAGLTRAGLDARFFAWPPPEDPDRPPYRGMRPLEAGDAGIFFGREAPTIEVLDRLRGLSDAAPPRVLVILGASGAGKSSFLRAGLLPRLQRDNRAYLPVPIVRPERAALTGETGLIRSLEAAAMAAGLKYSRADVKTAVDRGASTLRVILEALAAKAMGTGEPGATPSPRLVLAVDQGEELFLAEGAEEAKTFLALVADLARDPASNLIVFFTVRSDSFERLQTAPALDGIALQTLSLPPLPRGAYQTVIEGPAARLVETTRALKIEPALTAALLSDIEDGGAKDALPLLAFTLERLYLEHGGDGDLRLSEYRQLGGVKGSIDAAVEGALRAADGDPAIPRDRAVREALLRRALIPWLAGIDPETGAPRRRIARLGEIPEEARPFVAHLVAARLLATDRNPQTGETTVEPAHEALLRQWGLLQGWLEEDFVALSILEGLKRAARDWEANARHDNWLTHAAGRLEDAEALSKRDDLAGSLDAIDRAYLALARAAEIGRRDRELEEARRLAAAQKEAADAAHDAAGKQRTIARRTRVGLIAASVLAALAIVGAGYGFYQAHRADEQATLADQQRDAALVSQSRFLADQSRQRSQRDDYGTAVALALSALPKTGDPHPRPYVSQAEHALYEALLGLRERRVFQGHERAVVSVDFSPDGAEVLTASQDGTARLWNASTGEPIHLVAGQDGNLLRASFSPDGRLIATAAEDGMVRFWDASGQPTGAAIDTTDENLKTVEFSPDGTQLLTASTDGVARLWSTTDGSPIAAFVGHTDWLASATFSPDGQRVVTASADFTARIWSVVDPTKSTLLRGHTSVVNGAVFSPDGTAVLTFSADGTARIWDSTTGNTLAVLSGANADDIEKAAFASDGGTIVTLDTKAASRWDAQSYELIHTYPLIHEGGLVDFAIAPDSQSLAVSETSGTTVVFNFFSEETRGITLAGHTGRTTALAYAPDENTLLSGSDDGTARTWDVRANPAPDMLWTIAEPASGASLSPDDEHILVTSVSDHAKLINSATGETETIFDGGEGIYPGVFSPDGERIVTLSDKTGAEVWGLDGTLEKALAQQGPVTAAAFSSDGRRLVVGGDKAAAIWNTDTWTKVSTISEQAPVDYVAISSVDGGRVLTSTTSYKDALWDAEGRLIKVLREQAGWFSATPVFSRDGTKVASSQQNKVHIFDASTGDLLETLDTHEDRPVTTMAFSPDGSRFLAASLVGHVWDLDARTKVAELKGSADVIWDAVFSPDGLHILTASDDGTVGLWLAASGGQIGSITARTRDLAGAYGSRSDRFLVADSYESVLVARVFATAETLAEYARQVMPRDLSAMQREMFFVE